MRLVFTSLAAFGHVYPLLPLAVAARDAGHDVVFATAEGFLPHIRPAGLETAVAGMDVREAFDSVFAAESSNGSADPSGGEMPLDRMTAAITKVFGDLLPRSYVAGLGALFEDRRPDLVVYEASNIGGSFAARVAGIPSVGHTFGHVMRFEADPESVSPLADFAGELGLEWLGLAELGHTYVDICPDSVQLPGFRENVPRLPLRPVGWSGDGELPPGIAGRDSRSRKNGRPLVYLTLGTVMASAEVLRTAIAGLAVLDVDVLVAVGPTVDQDALGELPANVLPHAWLPQARVLPHVDAVVHHGGNGTMLGAFAAGIPQLVLPQGGDQFANSDAIAESGAGARLLGEDVTSEAITTRLSALLADTAVHDAARSVAAEIAAMPSPAEVAAHLPDHA